MVTSAESLLKNILKHHEHCSIACVCQQSQSTWIYLKIQKVFSLNNIRFSWEFDRIIFNKNENLSIDQRIFFIYWNSSASIRSRQSAQHKKCDDVMHIHCVHRFSWHIFCVRSREFQRTHRFILCSLLSNFDHHKYFDNRWRNEFNL